MWFSLLALSALAGTPRLHVELATPTRLSSLQPTGPAASGGCCGQSTPVGQLTLFESPYDLTVEALCFAVPYGTSTRPHSLAVLDVGVDGRPGALLYYSDDIFVSPTATSSVVLYCATPTDTDGTVVDDVGLVNALDMQRGDGLWLGFSAGNGLGNIGYLVANTSTSVPLGTLYPGGPAVRHLQINSFGGWASYPVAADVTNGQPVVVSVEIGPPVL